MDTILLLLDEVFLIAPVVGVRDNRFRGTCPVVGDVEKANPLVKQLRLPLGNLQVFPHDDHAVILITFDGHKSHARRVVYPERF